MFNKLFGGNKKEEAPTPPRMELKVYFHKDCNGKVEHGSIYADHAQLRLTNEPVRFSFDDVDPPVMTPDLLAHIWDMAECQGYIVHELRSYINVFPVHPRPNASLTTGSPRQPRQSMTRGLRRPTDDGARSAVTA